VSYRDAKLINIGALAQRLFRQSESSPAYCKDKKGAGTRDIQTLSPVGVPSRVSSVLVTRNNTTGRYNSIVDSSHSSAADPIFIAVPLKEVFPYGASSLCNLSGILLALMVLMT
jgi:hypothetical protein